MMKFLLIDVVIQLFLILNIHKMNNFQLMLTLSSIVISVISELLEKISLVFFITLSGIVILVCDEHLEKAYSPIFVTLFGIVILVSDEQF